MKFLFLTAVAGLLSFTAHGQTTATYSQLIDQAGGAMQARNMCGAVDIFEQAFRPDSTQASPFDLFGAAMSAAQCPAKQPLA